MILLTASAISAQAPAQVSEYEVKAAFLYNFAKFVEWPTQTFKGATDPIAICILGENPFGKVLDGTIRGKIVGGRAFEVRQLSIAESAQGCSILFVSRSVGKRFRAVAGALKGTGILSVGESDGFIADGGAINFKMEQGSVRLEINITAAEWADVRISSKLLSLAQIVRRAP